MEHLPRSDFAEAYLALVIPDLRTTIADCATSVASGGTSFSDTLADIRYEAIRRGARHLSPSHYDALMDWTAATLLTACIEAEKMADEADALIQSLLREPSRDILRSSVAAFIRG